MVARWAVCLSCTNENPRPPLLRLCISRSESVPRLRRSDNVGEGQMLSLRAVASKNRFPTPGSAFIERVDELPPFVVSVKGGVGSLLLF
jgi:hypothetical protein